MAALRQRTHHRPIVFEMSAFISPSLAMPVGMSGLLS
jgi:hypothetical protein